MGLLDRLFGPRTGGRDELKRIAGCRLLRKIAEGPMSTVYLARRPGGEKVAAKVLTPHGNRIAEKLSVKLGKPWEGERAKALSHPNVVETREAGKEKGNYFIIMEYLPGGSLAEHLRARREAILARRLEILIAAANGLAYVHEKGIIHRDVCPKNMMFDRQGTVKLIDFGVAIHKCDRLRPTETRTGRPSYLAPELIRYNRFNVQTDIYAFGVTLYEVYAGQRPFTADTRQEVMNLHLRAEPVPPSRMGPSAPAEVDRVVLKALAKVPQKRYPTMSQLAADLVRLRGVAS